MKLSKIKLNYLFIFNIIHIMSNQILFEKLLLRVSVQKNIVRQ